MLRTSCLSLLDLVDNCNTARKLHRRNIRLENISFYNFLVCLVFCVCNVFTVISGSCDCSHIYHSFI